MRNKNKKEKSSRWFILLGILLAFSYLAFYSARWCRKKYGDIGFDAVVYTMFSDLGGTSKSLILNYVKSVLPSTAVLSAVTAFVLFFYSEKHIFLRIGQKFKMRLYPFGNSVSALLSVILIIALIASASGYVGLDDWIRDYFNDSHIFEEEYIEPNDVKITFPERKRNLIYIYLESMENTFFSKELGGGLDVNVMPELYNLALENTNFSDSDGVGGCRQISGATWTMGAMVAQSAGIPLKISAAVINDNGNDMSVLPGVTTITDVLHKNGYYQTFLVGSEASFAGRGKFFSEHGVDEVYDYHTAVEEGVIPENYWEWWGMEDKYVYEYAKEKLTELSRRDEPFSFITLTTDTHHIGGYKCSLCEDKYSEQYENVYACASRQVTEFLKWLKRQDFYENTTVIITGDHCSMDAEYFERNISDDYTRRIYNCFINSAVESDTVKNREFSQFDMFPTTLAALGAKIEGNRLGLGVNLFSGDETLAEKYGFDELQSRLLAPSNMYNRKFIYNE